MEEWKCVSTHSKFRHDMNMSSNPRVSAINTRENQEVGIWVFPEPVWRVRWSENSTDFAGKWTQIPQSGEQEELEGSYHARFKISDIQSQPILRKNVKQQYSLGLSSLVHKTKS